MLVLTRKKGETILIGDNIEISIQQINGEQVKIGINAPRNLQVLRKELFEDVKLENQSAMEHQEDILDSLKIFKNNNFFKNRKN